MGIEWIDPTQKRSLQTDGVRLTKNTLAIGKPQTEALGDPDWIRVGIDGETQTVVIVPSDEAAGVSLRTYKGQRASVCTSIPILRTIRDQLGWRTGDELTCVVRGRTLEIKRKEQRKANRGQLLRAVGGDMATGMAYGDGEV